ARACRDLAGVRISAMDLQHPQPADLRLQLSTIGSNGEVLKTKTLFDGPNQAKGKTQKEIAAIRIAVDEDNPYSADDLIQSSTCDHFRLTVIDTVQQRMGTLVSWTLGLRTAVYPFAHDVPYYERLFFGGPGAGRNIADYYKEVSRGRFTFTSAGVYG